MAFGVGQEPLEDAIHDVFLHLIERGHRPWERKDVKYYLLNCLKNRLRSSRRREMTRGQGGGAGELPFEIKVDGFEIIEEEEERRALAARVESMLRALTARQREAIYLRYTQGLGLDEIAGLLGISLKATRKLLYRAIEQMRGSEPTVPLLLLLSRCVPAGDFKS
jgi:RNA polymerase sigma factor (sigma-70 family)